MSFWPPKRDFQEILITSIWALVSGFVWSILLFLIILLVSNFINIWDWFSAASANAWKTSVIFPIVLAVVAFLSTSLTSFVTYFFLSYANPERYKRNIVILWQIAFFTFFSFLFAAPAYIYSGLIDYDYIVIVFIIHTILIIFWVNLIIEILNNYRYILVSVYWSFVWLFLSMMFISLIFSSFDSNSSKLISMLFLLPLVSFLQVFFKWLFDFIYFHYNRITNLDQIGDIFYQIEMEEKEKLREEEEKNSI